MSCVDLWLADLEQHLKDLGRLESWLSDEERNKRSGMRMERVRNLSILSRGLLRQVLSTYLMCNPSEVVIETEPLGKPFLSKFRSNSVGSIVNFNVSHASELLAIAVDPTDIIGVDVEEIRDMDFMSSIATRLFSVEQQKSLREQTPLGRLNLFFRYWTHRESVTKALGVGFLENVELQYLSQPTGQSSNEPFPASCVSRLNNSSVRWSLLEFVPREGYTGCVAVVGVNKVMNTRWI